MKRVPHVSIVSGIRATPQMAVPALFCAWFALIAPAGAQTFGSSYASTAPGECRVKSAN